MVEHISNGTENMDEIAPFIILLVCLIVAHVVVTRLSKKENSASTSWFSKPIVDQTEDNKTEEESNPSPKSSSSVFHAAESEDTEDDTTYWTEKHDNSKTLFQEAILVQSPWECKQCTFINTSSKIRCEICGDSNGRVCRVSLPCPFSLLTHCHLCFILLVSSLIISLQSQRATASHDSHMPSTFPAMDDGTIRRHGVMKKKITVGKNKDL